MQPPEGPPVCTALYCLPSGMPPPIWWMISRRVMPMGTSMRPVFATRPARANTLVPLLFSVPMAANQAAPWRTMGAILAKVSTLLISVGHSHSPDSDRKSLVEGKRVDLGGRRFIKKTKKEKSGAGEHIQLAPSSTFLLDPRHFSL